MPNAPTDYRLRYPIDFGDIDASIRQRPVQLYAADFGKSRGILYMPAGGKPRSVVIMAHPRADFSTHYSIPYWVAAGFAAFGFNTRYLNNDAMMLHENLLLDLAAGIRYLREEEGFEKIVMLGNSGGGSLFAYYDAQARTPAGNRVTRAAGRRSAGSQQIRSAHCRRLYRARRASGTGDGADVVPRCGRGR